MIAPSSGVVAASASRPTSPDIEEVNQEEVIPTSPAEIVQRLHDSLDAWKDLSGLTKEVGKFVIKARVVVAKESNTRDIAQDTERDSKRRKMHDKKQRTKTSETHPCDLTSPGAITTGASARSTSKAFNKQPAAQDVRKIQRMANLCQQLIAAQKLFEKEIQDVLEEAEDLEVAISSDNDVASSAE